MRDTTNYLLTIYALLNDEQIATVKEALPDSLDASGPDDEVSTLPHNGETYFLVQGQLSGLCDKHDGLGEVERALTGVMRELGLTPNYDLFEDASMDSPERGLMVGPEGRWAGYSLDYQPVLTVGQLVDALNAGNGREAHGPLIEANALADTMIVR